MKEIKENGVKLVHKFKKARKQILKDTILSVALTLLSIGIVGTQIFYPFHVVIGLGIYILSFIPFIHRIYISRKVWKKYRAYSFAESYIRKEKKRLVAGVVIVVAAMSFFILRPLDSDIFTDISDEEITQLVRDDMYRSVTAMDYLETTGNQLLVTLMLEESDANTTEMIERDFSEFLTAVSFSESITDVHRYFDNIPYRLGKERSASFTISYSLYVKKYEIIHRMMTQVSGNEYQKKVLNEYIHMLERDGVYREIVGRFYVPKTRLRILAGITYMTVFDGRPESEYNGAYGLLRGKANESYSYLFTNFDKTLRESGEVLVDATKSKMFDVWFPIQKGVANSMGHAILSTRGKDYFITDEQVRVMQQEMQPGDLMLQRRNWHLSNVGIPGFWTHSAMYTGSISEMDTYFASEFPINGHESMSRYLEATYPEVYARYQTYSEDGDERAVIEAIEPGVVLQSLEHSAHADFVVALRPSLTKHDKMLALFKAFGHFGKPYDYNFDFDTRDAMVCSELLFDSYFERLPEKAGLHFETSIVNGRKIVAPLDMAKKFKAEHGTDDAELSFVYFLRGNEDTQSASVSTEEVFLESVTWNKFSFFQE